MGGKIRLVKLFGIKMIRNEMTSSPISMMGVYAARVALISRPCRRMSSEPKMAASNQAYSTSSQAAMVKK